MPKSKTARIVDFFVTETEAVVKAAQEVINSVVASRFAPPKKETAKKARKTSGKPVGRPRKAKPVDGTSDSDPKMPF